MLNFRDESGLAIRVRGCRSPRRDSSSGCVHNSWKRNLYQNQHPRRHHQRLVAIGISGAGALSEVTSLKRAAAPMAHR